MAATLRTTIVCRAGKGGGDEREDSESDWEVVNHDGWKWKTGAIGKRARVVS